MFLTTNVRSCSTGAVQRSFEDLGTPLADVTFCVLDVETTGTDRGLDMITEIGAVKVRGGECLGTLSTLVNPGRAIPPTITLLTGISESMIATAPRIESVLPTLQEFVGDAVVVGHNVGFDMAFINAALQRSGRSRLDNVVVDTLPLARRLVRDEVPDCRLGTLSARFRLDHQPSHRALADALATTDLLHLLLERSASLGVLGLDDLVALPRIGAHPQADKLRLTHDLPRAPGVYRFIGANDEVLYVGKATNLRQRVRSYFSSDDRRKIGGLLRATHRVAHTVLHDPIVAEVLESRFLHLLSPRYNRVGTTWNRYAYVRLTTDDEWPRLTITSEPSATGVHLGPLGSRAVATSVIEAIQTALPIRRCATRIGRRHRPTADATPCTGARLGVAMCPCTGHVDRSEYWGVVSQVVAALTTSPRIVLDPLWLRISRLSAEQRYEEAAATRDRANAFAAAIVRQRQMDRLRAAGDMELQIRDTVLHIVDGVLLDSRRVDQLALTLDLPAPAVPPHPLPLPRQAADEVLSLARALERHSHEVRLLHCSGEWADHVTPVPTVTRLARAA